MTEDLMDLASTSVPPPNFTSPKASFVFIFTPKKSTDVVNECGSRYRMGDEMGLGRRLGKKESNGKRYFHNVLPVQFWHNTKIKVT
ncbi:hypothetical protein VTL71DRAFT_7359 [Oculimacula yallundae]|uniref:Uncharacterized protein n=1 Tax=Oculimacula yallundae TaxID=86028 RepID=A0ABR4BXX5_9HELO